MSSVSSLTEDQKNLLPPWLLEEDDVTIISARVSSKRITPDYALYTYNVIWEEPYDGSTASSASRIISSQTVSSYSNESIPLSKSIGSESASKLNKSGDGKPRCDADYSSSAEDISLMSRLTQRSSGTWTEPNECEMISCRATLIEKDITGCDIRIKLFAEHPATTHLSEVVEDLLTSAENGGEKAKVFVIPVGKGKRLKLLEKKKMERKMVKDVERHRGNVCLVIDNTAN